MPPDKLIITIHHGKVAAVHATTWIDVSVINEDVPTNGDASYVAGLKHERAAMDRIYPAPRKPRHRRS